MTQRAPASGAPISEVGAIGVSPETRDLLSHAGTRYNTPGLSVRSFGRF
jgi:hypothetical protein